MNQEVKQIKVIDALADDFRKRAADKSTLWYDEVSNFILKAVKQDEKEARDQYSFNVSCTDLVFLPEIAEDVTRKNPVVEVVQQGKDFKKNHFLLVHGSLVLKGKLLGLSDNMTQDSDVLMRSILKRLKFVPVTSTVYAIPLNSTISFRKALGIVNWVRDFPMTKIGYPAVDKKKPIKIIVRNR